MHGPEIDIEEVFEGLNDSDYFSDFVTRHYDNVWSSVTSYPGCQPVLDRDQLRKAHACYMAKLEWFADRVDSGNPDQYKRAAALLYALHTHEVVTDFEHNGYTIEELEGNTPVGLSYDDCQFLLGLTRYFQEFGREIMCFDLAFRCCQGHPDLEKPYTEEYLQNMCLFLNMNPDPDVVGLYMILVSFHS